MNRSNSDSAPASFDSTGRAIPSLKCCPDASEDRIGKPYTLRLADLEVAEERGVQVDVSDFDLCRAACENVDTVVHLAGVASPDSSFEQILPVNIVGTYNIFQAALE